MYYLQEFRRDLGQWRLKKPLADHRYETLILAIDARDTEIDSWPENDGQLRGCRIVDENGAICDVNEP